MKFGKVFTLALIIVLALVLRIYNLDKVPPSLFGDEVDVGYQAYSLLKTGKDLQGNSWPVIIHSLSEYRAPLFIYSDIPFLAVLGLNEWGVRISSVFWGVWGVLGLYLLARILFNDKVALFSALTLAISPWHIQYSRAAFEVTMLLTFLTFGSYFFIKGLEKRWLLAVSGLIFALTPYIYSTATVFMPLLILMLLLIYRKGVYKVKHMILLTGLILLLILIPYSYQTFLGEAGGRFNIISIFSNQDLQDKVLVAQASENLPLGLEKLFHNKPIVWLQAFTTNYLRAFSPEFLFLNGDPNFRHSVHEMGQQYYFELILLLFGTWVLLKSNLTQKRFILGWLLLAPIPAAFTFDGGFHATRTFIMLVPLSILIGVGGTSFLSSINIKRAKIFTRLIIILAVINIGFYFHRYFYHYPNESWLAWQYGFKEVMEQVKLTESSFDKVIINNTYEPALIRFLFWSKYDPTNFHQQFKGDKTIQDVTQGFDGFLLANKFYFGKLNTPFENYLDNKTLYIASARDDITNPDSINHSNVKLIRLVFSPSNQPLFYILTGVKNAE